MIPRPIMKCRSGPLLSSSPSVSTELGLVMCLFFYLCIPGSLYPVHPVPARTSLRLVQCKQCLAALFWRHLSDAWNTNNPTVNKQKKKKCFLSSALWFDIFFVIIYHHPYVTVGALEFIVWCLPLTECSQLSPFRWWFYYVVDHCAVFQQFQPL